MSNDNFTVFSAQRQQLFKDPSINTVFLAKRAGQNKPYWLQTSSTVRLAFSSLLDGIYSMASDCQTRYWQNGETVHVRLESSIGRMPSH